MTVIESLLDDLPIAERGVDVYIGGNWILSVIRDADGVQQAGVASTPLEIGQESRFQIGHQVLNDDPQMVAGWLLSQNELEAAIGLATLNALLQPSQDSLQTVDATDWLSERSAGLKIAIVGRFPFIEDEIRPFAQVVWVFEHEPQQDEYGPDAMAKILPQADIAAITGSTLINHTLDGILVNLSPECMTILLGPSTPLSDKLLEHGIDVLFGVQVVDVGAAIDSILGGHNFQKLNGLRRVSLFNPRLTG